MKAKVLAIILLVALIPPPPTYAQTPVATADVSIECSNDTLNIKSLFSITDYFESNRSIDYSPIVSDVQCQVSNPTAYTEKVVISTSTNFPAMFDSIDELEIGAGQSENFSISVNISENFLDIYDSINKYWFYTNASVREIGGFPPVNVASDSNIVTQIDSENGAPCTDCFVLHSVVTLFGERPLKIGMKAPAVSGDLYNGATWNSFNSDDVFEPNSTSPFSSAWTALQFIDLNCNYCRQAASEEMLEWPERYDESNTSNGSQNVDFTTIVSMLIPFSGTDYDFAVTDAAGSPTLGSNDDLVYVAMDAGQNLSWSDIYVYLHVDGDSHLCTKPSQPILGGCSISDNGDEWWLFGEEVTISEGDDNLCWTVCDVRITIYYRTISIQEDQTFCYSIQEIQPHYLGIQVSLK